jgi:hypothetical protein
MPLRASSDEPYDGDDHAHEDEEHDRGLHPDPQRVHGSASLVTDPLTPRARAILAAVEREVSARIDTLGGDAPGVAPRRADPFSRPEPELLLALELGVAGLTRAEVAAELRMPDPEPVLDAVFGRGSASGARLRRAA